MARFTRSDIREIIGDACTEEMESKLIAKHLAVVDPLKDDLQKAKASADRLEDVQKELDDLKAKGSTDWETKYNDEHAAFEQYKADQSAKETRTAKEKAVKAFFEGKHITGANLTIAMRGVKKEELDALDLDDNGQLKDTKALDALVQGEFAGLVVKTTEKGSPSPTPPGSNGTGKMTKEEIMAIKDTATRQAAMLENAELFGL